jgi:hypothetical protein
MTLGVFCLRVLLLGVYFNLEFVRFVEVVSKTTGLLTYIIYHTSLK